MRLGVQPFTLVGATTKAGNVSSPLVSRFGITCRFSFEEKVEMEAIVRRSAGILHIAIDDDAAALLAVSSRGTPRVVNRLLRRMRDFAQVLSGPSADGAGGLKPGKAGSVPSGAGPQITKAVVTEGLKRLEIDGLGLEKHDREILRIIIERYGGGPVGAETLAISAGEAVDTLEDYYEPYLIQAGLLQRTSRGRMVTSLAYKHLKLPERKNESGGLLF
jgi:Holliday junction DNA helicase RuvB